MSLQSYFDQNSRMFICTSSSVQVQFSHFIGTDSHSFCTVGTYRRREGVRDLMEYLCTIPSKPKIMLATNQRIRNSQHALRHRPINTMTVGPSGKTQPGLLAEAGPWVAYTTLGLQFLSEVNQGALQCQGPARSRPLEKVSTSSSSSSNKSYEERSRRRTRTANFIV